MRTLTLIAIATMSMWIADQANAQQQKSQTDNAPAQEQVEGQKDRKGKSKRGGQGRRGKRGQGMDQQQGQGMQKNQQRGRRGGAQMLDGLFTRFDKDKNGSISLAEAPERMKNRFKTLDTNGDKAVSKEELQAAFAQKGQGQGKGRKGQSKGGKGKDGAGKGKGRDKGKDGQRQMLDPAKMLQSMDKNNDGVISADEAPEKMKQRFDRIDADSSGTISADELKAAFDKLKKGRKGKDGQIGRNKSADGNATKPVEPKRPPMAKEGA